MPEDRDEGQGHLVKPVTEGELRSFFEQRSFSLEEWLELAQRLAIPAIESRLDSFFKSAHNAPPPADKGWYEEMGVLLTLAQHFDFEVVYEMAELTRGCERAYRHGIATEMRRRDWAARRTCRPRNTPPPPDWFHTIETQIGDTGK